MTPPTSNLLGALAEASREHPLARKILLCRQPAEGRELLRALTLRANVPWIGWEVRTPRLIALDLVGGELARDGLEIADAFRIVRVVEDAIEAVREAGRAGPFAGDDGAAGYRDAIHHVIATFRYAGITPDQLRTVGEGGDGHTPDPKLAALGAILREYERRLERGRVVDGAGVRTRAAAMLRQADDPFDGARLFLVPGLAAHGLEGRLVRLLGDLPGAERLPAETRPDGAVEAASTDTVETHATGAAEAPPAGASVASPGAANPDLFAAAGPTHELREALRRAVASGEPWDRIEIIATEPAKYGAILDSLTRRLGIPVTFATGVDSRRTRVGRAVAGYLGWLRESYPADILRSLIESRCIEPRTARNRAPAEYRNAAGNPQPGSGDEAAPEFSGPALAHRLRRLRISQGRAAYAEAIDRALEAATKTRAAASEDQDLAEAEERLAVERAELETLRAWLVPILEASPEAPDRLRARGVRTSPARIATGLGKFLESVPDVDGSEGSALDRIRHSVDRIEQELARDMAWSGALALVDSLLTTRVAGSGEDDPGARTTRGGRLHFADVKCGGLAGRPVTFVVGLRAGRAAVEASADPLLNDGDVARLNEAAGALTPLPAVRHHHGRQRAAPGARIPPLPLSAERADERRRELDTMLARLRGRITLSYSTVDADGRAVAPAPALLHAFRRGSGNATASYSDLHAALGRPIGAVPGRETRLDSTDVWLGHLLGGGVARDGLPLVRARHPGLDAGLTAAEMRVKPEITECDGRVRSVESKSVQLDPTDANASGSGAAGRLTGEFSATQLEALGTCPRRYFYQYMLRARPPRDREWDPLAWLNAAERGGLLHRVYERTLGQARSRGLDFDDPAFADLALDTLAQEAESLHERLPAPGDGVRSRESETLREDVLAFVAMIRDQRPEWLERELYFDGDSVVIETDAGPVSLRGAMDRVDAAGAGGVRVVDYKTGSSSRYRAARPYDGGRRIQHVVYLLAAAELLDREPSAAEYHFPTRRGQLNVVSYEPDRLGPMRDVLGRYVRLAAEGPYLTTEEQRDCTYCAFADVCRVRVDDYGGATSPRAKWAKDHGLKLPAYEPLRALRNLDE